MADNIIQTSTPALNISDIANSALLKEGAIIEAVIKDILANNNYLLDVKGMLMEMSLPLMLQLGDKVSLKVAELSDNKMVLNMLPQNTEGAKLPPVEGLEPILHITENDISSLLAKISVPPTGLNKNIAAELIRQNAPVTAQTIEAISDIVSKPPLAQEDKISASVFLVSKGIQPTTDLVNKLANANSAISDTTSSNKTEIISSAMDFVKGITVALSDKQAQLPAKLPLTDYLPPEVKEAIASALDNSVPLRVIDNTIEFINIKLEAAKQAISAKPDSDLVNTTFKLLVKELEAIKQKNDGGVIPAEIRSAIEMMAKESLDFLKSKILDLERKEIASNPLLAQARAEKGNALDIIDRVYFNRLVNQIGAIKEDGVYITQLIAKIDGVTTYIPVRVFRDKQGRGKAQSKSLTTFALDIDMSKIGKIGVITNISAKSIDVKFKVRRKSVKELFQRHELELKTQLQDMGYEAISISTEISEKKQSIFSDIGDTSSKPYISVDIKV